MLCYVFGSINGHRSQSPSLKAVYFLLLNELNNQ